MQLTNEFYKSETNTKKRLIYHPPLPLKPQRILVNPEPNGPVHIWTKEEIRAMLQSDTKLVR